MAVCSLSSPCGFPVDEEEDVAVFESTAADLLASARPRLPELSVISPGTSVAPSRGETSAVVPPAAAGEDVGEKVKVFLRIRPMTAAERERGEDQGAVGVLDEETLLLKAPKDSQSQKTVERGIGPSVHRFSFSKIFGPDTTQQEFYENTMKTMVKDVLQGENRLLYTYGVTNSGKTYTVQGSGREAGLLPRALCSMFRCLQGRLYGPLDLKPVMYHEVRHLQPGEVRAEEVRRRSLLKEDEGNSTRRVGTTSIWDSGLGGVSTSTTTQLEDSSSVCLDPDSLTHLDVGQLEAGLQFSVWVSFYEIYNEFLYDLLDASPTAATPRKRVTLRLADDRQGNPFVKDLTWVQVRSAEEAWRILKVGRKNQSFASTHLNHNSSRSHSIFSIRLLHIQPDGDSGRPTNISELTVCDLAGSERCKQQRSGERMKEATNINTSLLTLGRCITALRHNQSNRSRPPLLVPFRDSKLTRVLQGFFCGGGASVMVVNINTCSSVYDETLQALKFSAIATQLVHGPSTRTRVAYILSLLREPLSAGNDSTVMEEEEEEEEEEESEVEDGDITMLNTESLLRAIDVLKREVQRQRGERETLEEQLRETVVSEMMEVVNNMQDGFTETLEAERALMEQRYEDKISNLQKHLKLFYSQELKDRDQEIEYLSAALNKHNAATANTSIATATVAMATMEELTGPRRSVRLSTQNEATKLRSDLERCRAELDAKTQEVVKLQSQLVLPGPSGSLVSSADRKLEEGQRNLRQLRSDLQRLGVDLRSGGRACCHNTGAERLRHALTTATDTLTKQDQTLSELVNALTLVRSDLRRKAELLSLSGHMTTPLSNKKRACMTPGDSENRPPTKKPFFQSLLPPSPRYGTRRAIEDANATPYSRILRSRQQSPPRSPAPATPRLIRGKY